MQSVILMCLVTVFTPNRDGANVGMTFEFSSKAKATSFAKSALVADNITGVKVECSDAKTK